jgi:hypothetical protein
MVIGKYIADLALKRLINWLLARKYI